MKKFEKMILMFIACFMIFSMVSFAEATFSDNWVQEADGTWKIKDKQNNNITDAWVCDDAVEANGKDVWYLLDKDGNMVSAGLVQDGTGNYYSLETNHNGYYGMLRYKSGTYDGIYLELDGEHNGSFAAIKNQDGIDALKAKYGLTTVDIDNYNIVYTSENVITKLGNNGWVQYESGDTYYYVNGKPVTGWQSLNGNAYYFGSDGILYRSRYTPDGYYVNADGIWDGKGKKTAEEQNTASVSEETTDVNDPDYEEPQIWDTASKNNLITTATKASNLIAASNSLIAEAQKLTDRKAAVKKYYNAFGKACGSLEQLSYMSSIISERPSLKLADGSDALTSLKTAIKTIESFETFDIDDTVDITSAGFKNKLNKITEAGTIINQILTAANAIEATPNTK